MNNFFGRGIAGNKGLYFLRKQPGSKYLIILYLISCQSLYYMSCTQKNEGDYSETEYLLNHPVYAQYNFRQKANVVTLGIQPPYLFAGNIFEAIKWNNITKRRLTELEKVDFLSFMKGADGNSFLQNGLMQAGYGGDTPALTESSRSDIIAPVLVQNGNVTVVPKELMVTEAIQGKTITYSYGSEVNYFNLELLQPSGIDHDDVKLVPIEVFKMMALEKNKVYLCSTWEPNVTLTLNKHPEFFITYRRISTG